MLAEAEVSQHYLSGDFPKAWLTAFWHKKNWTGKNWLVPHRYDIEYSFNDYGYRDRPWSSCDYAGIWCLGDSQTVGMGVAQEQIWPNLLDVNSINLAVAGASNDTIARTLCSALKLHRPRAVCVLLTAPNRREIINQFGSVTLFPHSLRHLKNIDIKMFEEFLNSTDSISDQINRDKNILLIKNCCDAMNIPLIIADFDVAIKDLIKNDVAADGLHIGAKTHKQIAMFFKKKLFDIEQNK